LKGGEIVERLFQVVIFRNDGVQAGVRILDEPDTKQYPTEWSQKASLHVQARKFACGKKYHINEVTIDKKKIL